MSEVMRVCRRLELNAFEIALATVRFLILCAAQSALISVAGIPHTFSV